MRDKLLSIAGGTTGGVWQALTLAMTDAEWLIRIIIGAIVGTVVSIALNELYKCIQRLLKSK